jgi:predicted acyl esterase
MNRTLLSVLFLVTCATAALSQPDRHRAITIPTRDGKTLAADLYASDTTVAKPTILIQTPYNKNLYRLAILIPPQAGGSPFPYDSAHYNYVVLDWRGFFGSSGAAVIGYDRGLDGYDAVEWIAVQAWCNGKVGTWGPSALGAIQFMTAKHHPPHLVCSVPLVKDFKTKYSDFYYGGDYRREHVTSLQQLGLTDTTLILAHPTNDALWQITENSSNDPDSIAVPMFLISGWYDHFPDDVIRAFNDLRAKSAPSVRTQHRLMMGPWMHEGVGKAEQGVLSYTNAVGTSDAAALAFYDFYLRNISNGFDATPNVQYYEMGANEWRTTDDWYGLCSTADSLSLYFTAGGMLTFVPSSTGTDTITFDPRDPSPTIGGARLAPFDQTALAGPQDMSAAVEPRQDIPVFSSPVLGNNLSILGGVQVQLFVSSDRFDTDFSARLCDVYPDGRSILITQGIRRMRFRNGFRPADTAAMVPETIYPVTIELQNLAMTFVKGHRLRIDITSSNYPQYDINPNTGGKLYAAGPVLTAKNVVYHSAEYRSRIIFPSISLPSSVEMHEDMAGESLVFERVLPNPFMASATVEFALTDRGDVAVELFDLLGNRQGVAFDGLLEAGRHAVQLNASGLASGTYICRVSTASRQRQQVVQVVR